MRTKTTLLLATLILALWGSPSTVRAQKPGTLDTSFDPGTGPTGDIKALALSDDKIIAVGAFTQFNGTAQSYIVQLNADGTVDTGFNVGAGANAPVKAIAVKVNGQIMVGGAFTFFGGAAQSHLARLNKNGSLDTTFKTGAGADGDVTAIAAQTDGKVVVAGAFTKFDTTACGGLVRLNPNGSVDTTFTPPADVTFDGAALLLQPDGKIVTLNPFVRLNADGTLDTSFQPDPGLKDGDGNANCGYLRALGLQSDGSIVYVGDSTSVTGEESHYSTIGRLAPDGSDLGFLGGYEGNDAGSHIGAVAVQANDKFVVGGDYFYRDFEPYEYGGFASCIAADNKGSFALVDRIDDTVEAVVVQDDGRIVIAGAFSSVDDGTLRPGIARTYGDDGPGQFNFKTNAFHVTESQASATVQVRRQGGNEGAVSVAYFTVDDTAKAGTDYTSKSGVLNWANGDNAVRSIVIPLLNPGVSDGGTRTFQVGLGLPKGGAAVGPMAAASVAILDNDLLKPVITSPATASGTVGTAFSYQITASNTPASYGVLGLPPGLTVNAATGLLSGTPTKAGKFTLTLKATNNGGVGTAQLTLTVAPGAPVITSALTATATQDAPFTYQITATNDPTYFATANNLGLSVDHATGKITGTPTANPGTYAITLKASNAQGVGQATLSITIKAAAPVITSAANTSGKVGKAFTYQITATHNPANYAVINQAPGLHVDTKTGLISGTPTKVGTYQLTLKAANPGGVGQKPLTVTITN